MLEAVLRHLKNWFIVPNGIHTGTFVVEDGSVVLPFLSNGQYYRIIGSVFNDGLHQYGADEGLKDETFEGTIWALAVPASILAIAKEVKAWEDKHGAEATGPYQSESFGGYSYTKATDANSGGAVTWESAFRARLNPYRRFREV